MTDRDTRWKDTFVVSAERWEQMYADALECWDGLKNIIKNEKINTESRYCPMHPRLFFQLSRVNGFNRINGYTYIEYIVKWRIRYL